MKNICLVFIIATSFVINVYAQEAETSVYQFKLLRQEDSLNDVINKENKNLYHRLKVIRMGSDNILSFGGSYRDQFEYFQNEEFSFSPNRENGWFKRRFLLHSNLQLGEGFRVFGEFGSSWVEGKEIIAPVDKDRRYINQLFAQFNRGNLIIKLGRENLKLGSRRLLDPREGPNIRQSFDHITFQWRHVGRSYRVFAGSPVESHEGVFDNRAFQNEEWLWGFYMDRLLTGHFHFDVYYLGFHNESMTYELGTAREWRHSVGTRMWKTWGKWQYDNEGIIQLGTFGEQDILAWTISFNIKNKVSKKNSLGVKTELISGSTSRNTLGTFNPLYPRGAYFGRVARFGPANLIDIHPYWIFQVKKFTMEIDYDIFWRFSIEDAVYGPPLNIVLEGGSNKHFIAHQIGTIFNYEFNSFSTVELETNFILPGDYIDEVRQGAQNLLHIVFTSELRF